MAEITTEEALKMQIETLQEQLRQTTEALELANEQINKIKANEAERVKADLIERGGFKASDLAGRSNAELLLMQITLDRAGITTKGAGIKKSADLRKGAASGLTVGRWDADKKAYVGAD
jgi:hypothetical protein